MDGLEGHYAKLNESDRERQVLYDITYIWNQKNTNKLMNITKRSRLTDTENKLVVTSGEREGGTGKKGQKIKRYKLLDIE